VLICPFRHVGFVVWRNGEETRAEPMFEPPRVCSICLASFTNTGLRDGDAARYRHHVWAVIAKMVRCDDVGHLLPTWLSRASWAWRSRWVSRFRPAVGWQS